MRNQAASWQSYHAGMLNWIVLNELGHIRKHNSLLWHLFSTKYVHTIKKTLGPLSFFCRLVDSVPGILSVILTPFSKVARSAGSGTYKSHKPIMAPESEHATNKGCSERANRPHYKKIRFSYFNKDDLPTWWPNDIMGKPAG